MKYHFNRAQSYRDLKCLHNDANYPDCVSQERVFRLEASWTTTEETVY